MNMHGVINVVLKISLSGGRTVIIDNMRQQCPHSLLVKCRPLVGHDQINFAARLEHPAPLLQGGQRILHVLDNMGGNDKIISAVSDIAQRLRVADDCRFNERQLVEFGIVLPQLGHSAAIDVVDVSAFFGCRTIGRWSSPISSPLPLSCAAKWLRQSRLSYACKRVSITSACGISQRAVPEAASQ